MSEPRDIGINLTAAEVLAALGGTLREVRRSVKGVRWVDGAHYNWYTLNRAKDPSITACGTTDAGFALSLVKYAASWRPGDRLWVREAWAYFGGDEYLYQRDVGSVHYRATFQASSVQGFDYVPGGRWRSSQQMPRWASRLTLVVTGVRAELVGERWEWVVDVRGVEL